MHSSTTTTKLSTYKLLFDFNSYYAASWSEGKLAFFKNQKEESYVFIVIQVEYTYKQGQNRECHRLEEKKNNMPYEHFGMST